MSHKEKNDLLLDLYRTEIIEGAKLRDNLYDENNRLLIENDDLEAEVEKLSEELSEAHYKNKRLEEKLEDLKKIKMSDEVTIPDVLKKSPAATDDGKDS